VPAVSIIIVPAYIARARHAMSALTSELIRPDVLVDRTHMGRRASGIERLTETLFSAHTLSPLRVGAMETAGDRISRLARQTIGNAIHGLREPQAVCVFPGFPPSPAFRFMRERTVMYVHDVFLLTRAHDLNWAGRLYLAPMFRAALASLRYFLVNSATTGEQVAGLVKADAEIRLYRPRVDNVFGLKPRPPAKTRLGAPLTIGALGTIEPRKNFPLAARICERASQLTRRPVTLEIIGRKGWGRDFGQLLRMPHVRLRGFLSDADAREVIEGFDLFMCTSHDEGLGLPLLEVQFAAVPVIAPEAPVFREVLGTSGIHFQAGDVEHAARTIAALVERPNWSTAAAEAARKNVERWNAQADADRAEVIAFLTRLRDQTRGRTAPAHPGSTSQGTIGSALSRNSRSS
jgi:glycosyltransferase involved in cell wall biosynthesis